jgi:Tol biopolymer transport system component
VRDARGRGTERRVTRHATAQQYANSWTPDGRSIVFEAFANDTGSDLQMVTAADGEAAAQRLLQTRANETAGRVSPDGRWLAYVSANPAARKSTSRRFPSSRARGPSPAAADPGRSGAVTGASCFISRLKAAPAREIVPLEVIVNPFR